MIAEMEDKMNFAFYVVFTAKFVTAFDSVKSGICHAALSKKREQALCYVINLGSLSCL
jgi:hypothetical protein